MLKKINPAGVLSLAMLMGCSAETEKKMDDDHKEDVTWSYAGETGPSNWHTLHPEYAACGEGEKQSPINIDVSTVELNDDLEALDLTYQSTPFSLENNGHTIQLTDPTGENSIEVQGEEYTLQQLHFHTPSENSLNGNHFEMEGHLVHQNEAGELAVLAFLIEEGKNNSVLAEAFSNMPSENNKEELASNVKLDLLLPEDMSTFHYSGSLTTPPCSEGVRWVVLEEPIQLSEQQIKTFSEHFPHGNAREPQPLNKREVYVK
ncbi:carbonic anhydrase [Bacillus sp. RAR_GA_16]|uniref:carbonic anhydrase n=1 Tax=Bacillus sp. RAR_GA_16 TaxID=2876774 RepID=UPI001CCCAD75|nr:carbonic anhydrase family protein [Bacillus sp. RAR_GA_16]MCA0171344.1 carbonic anhydrase family protein [Bacillus sp. RAR_GA_16]